MTPVTKQDSCSIIVYIYVADFQMTNSADRDGSFVYVALINPVDICGNRMMELCYVLSIFTPVTFFISGAESFCVQMPSHQSSHLHHLFQDESHQLLEMQILVMLISIAAQVKQLPWTLTMNYIQLILALQPD